MPKMDGIEATKRLKQYDETIKVLILSSFSEQDYVIPALEAGADGYQLKKYNLSNLSLLLLQYIKEMRIFTRK